MRKWLAFLFAASMAVSSVPSASLAEPGNTCVYVLGTVGGKTVTTPAVPVEVPESGVTTGPAAVHVDSTVQRIIGYSLPLPGVDALIPASQGIYIPGYSGVIPSFTAKLDDLGIGKYACVSYGVTTPAVPVHIPSSALEVPGAAVDLPAVGLNLLGTQRTVGGKMLTVDGRRILIPGAELTLASQQVQAPDSSLSIHLNGSVENVSFLAPNN
ncbi:hypothetical protein J2T17_002068 [Paenibacillus mucilaginosus]|uniref:hypothetical protein n=1 Tax=Paenibacillus mucilaginosus TaxID=61624 RepID=UPI003D22AD65